MTAIGTRAKLGAGVLLAGALVASAVAQTQPGALPAAVQRLLDCRKLTDGPARLACYDGAVAELARAFQAGDVVALDHERVATVRRQAFGFSLSALNIFDRSDKPAETERLTATVERAYQQANRAWVLELEGGAVWVQTDDEPVPRPPKRGSKAEIRKAALGTFFINLDGQRAIRAKRVQ